MIERANGGATGAQVAGVLHGGPADATEIRVRRAERALALNVQVGKRPPARGERTK